ncbi:MAG: histone deacetylase, partial [Myxococcales bacterium]|nr:histone deacetylase [Myxococcales bacterium]
GNYNEIGEGRGEGFTVNVPLAKGTDDAAYLRVFREIVGPVSHAFRPDLVLISAGFDAHLRDPLGGMGVSEEGFAAMMGILGAVADETARGRVALILEGGYDLIALERSVAEVLRVLLGERDAPKELEGDADYADAVIQKVKTQLGPWWSFAS